MKETAQKIISWLQKQVGASNSHGVLLGFSGGLDSSVVGVLCKKAFPEKTLALILPCLSNPEDMKDAQLIAEKFNIPTKKINLFPIFEKILEELEGTVSNCEEANNLPLANLKSRLRMMTLYYYSNKLNYLVVGSGNKSEITIGYFTKYGDSGVDLLPLGNLYKTQVRALGKELGLPQSILAKPPSAGLWPGQTDEKELGISYQELDEVLAAIEKGETSTLNPNLIKKVKSLIKNSEHKRQLPKICKLNCSEYPLGHFQHPSKCSEH